MKKVFCVALTCAGLAGCMTSAPEARTGWRFEVMKPPLVISPPNATAVTSAHSAGFVGIDQNTSLASVPAAAEAAAMCEASASARRPAAIRVYAAESVRAGAAAGCNLDDVCQRLDRLERQLHGPAAPALPMPKQ